MIPENRESLGRDRGETGLWYLPSATTTAGYRILLVDATRGHQVTVLCKHERDAAVNRPRAEREEREDISNLNFNIQTKLDFLNLFGCLLEPATLPTQFYMALLYTVTTLTLALQAIYYGLIYPRLKSNKQFQKATITDQIGRVGSYSQGGNNGGEKFINGIGQCRPTPNIIQSGITASSPIPLPTTLPRCHSAEQDSYYRSARSLSSSHTPTRSSFIAP